MYVDASYQVSVYLAKRFQMRRFLEISTNQKESITVAAIFVSECLLKRMLILFRSVNNNGHHSQFLFLIGPFLKIFFYNLHRGPPIDASYQVSVQLTKRFQRRFLEIDQSETRIACGGHVC
jgi:hypothetical protein